MHELYTFILGELRGTWRFRWFALIVAWLVAMAGAFVVLTMPDEYRVSARVNVDTESLLGPLLGGLAVAPDMNQRVSMLTNTILNRENLERIAREADLMVRARTPADEERIIENLGRSIRISGGGRGSTIYRISYASDNPQVAYRVVQTVVELFSEEALGMTRADSASATGFLERQVEEYENRLRSAEQRLAQFKRDNVGLLPEQGGRDFYGRLRATEDEIQRLQNAQRQAERRVGSLREEIAAIESGQRVETSSNPQLIAVQEQLREARSRLDELLLRFTESHPDVRALQAQIERHEERRAELEDAPAVTETADLSANPLYQELRIRLNEWSAEIGAIEEQISDQEDRREQLLAQVDEITDVETRLQDLNRNYDTTRERYQALVARLSTAQLSGEVDASGGQLSLRLIDPPVRPLEPDGPPRDFYLLALIPVAFAVGGGFGFFLPQIRPVFQSRTSLAELTGRPVLGSVSLVMTRNQRRRKVVAFLIFALAAMMLAGAVAAASMYAELGAEYIRLIMRRLPI